jgi:hypothetical protein
MQDFTARFHSRIVHLESGEMGACRPLSGIKKSGRRMDLAGVVFLAIILPVGVLIL